jgi:hypothetical protein
MGQFAPSIPFEGGDGFGFVVSEVRDQEKLADLVELDSKLRGVARAPDSAVLSKVPAVLSGLEEHAAQTGNERACERIRKVFADAVKGAGTDPQRSAQRVREAAIMVYTAGGATDWEYLYKDLNARLRRVARLTSLTKGAVL